jgi:hypothetical protein
MERKQDNRQAGEQEAIPPLTLLDGALAVLVGAVSMILYVRTLHPHLLPGDSGELWVLARLLGNTHPNLTAMPIAALSKGTSSTSALLALSAACASN